MNFIDHEKEISSMKPTRNVKQVLCCVCCARYGTASLDIHQRVCLKQHKWALDLIAHEKGVPKEEALQNRKKCTDPDLTMSLPLPNVNSLAREFDDYNAEALAIFFSHSEKCLYCRTRNHEAIENARCAAQIAQNKHHADDEAKRKHEEEEEERHRQEEAERHRLEEERLKHALEEEEAHRKAEEEEEAHRRAEEEAKRKHDEEVAAMEEEARKRREETERKVAEDAARREAEEAARIAALEEERQKALAQAEDEARRKALEEEHRLAEENRQRALAEEAKRLADEEKKKKEENEDEDTKMMKLIKQEEEERRRLAEEKAREKKRIALGQHKYLKKHDGVLASSQSAACYEDRKNDAKAIQDMAQMSLAHAKKENLIKDHHQIGGDTFHSSHTSKVEIVEIEVDSDTPS